MNTEIAVIPDGATHYDTLYQNSFYRKNNGEFEFYSVDDGWRESNILESELSNRLLPITPFQKSSASNEKLERLRDELAMHMAGHLISKLNITGYINDCNGLYDQLLHNAYKLADAALKARESK